MPYWSATQALVHTHSSPGEVKFSKADMATLKEIGRYRRDNDQPLPFASYVSNRRGDVYMRTVDADLKISKQVYVGNAWNLERSD